VRAKEPNFGEAIRTRRKELDLTQAEVASRIKTSPSYVAHLESGKRRPSSLVVTRLAKVLRLDNHELFFLAHSEGSVSAQPDPAEVSASVWDQFRKDKQLQHIHKVSKAEMKMISQTVGCNFAGVRSPRDLIFILNAIRHALGGLAVR
jgi:transcriptional regulator with XRE-family HTH domain